MPRKRGYRELLNLEKPLHPVHKIERTLGQKASDALTKFAGSWAFILFLVIFMIIWIYVNITAYLNKWDPYPFILLNFLLSCLAGIQAPIILMSQNREIQRDRQMAEYDYRINEKAEREIEEVQKDLKEIKDILKGRR